MTAQIEDYTIIKEGEAEILLHANNDVFYNKTQVNSRDISIAVLRTFAAKRAAEHGTMSKKHSLSCLVPENTSASDPVDDTPNVVEIVTAKSGGECNIPSDSNTCYLKEKSRTSDLKLPQELRSMKVLEALSASGLRALRYALEIEEVEKVVALDSDAVAIDACKRNIKFNGSIAISKVEPQLGDARVHMLTHLKEYDAVDIDPYGSPSIFLDSAVQSVADGGLLMCTATDMAVLCGGNGEVCYSKYGSYPLRGKYFHEMALRILLCCIEGHANRYKRHIVPVLSVRMDFYIRVFVRIYTSAIEVKNAPLKLSYVYQCIGCDSFHLQPVGRTITKNNSVKHLPGFGPAVPELCSHCGRKYNMGGPIWTAPIHDQDWVHSMLENMTSVRERYPAYDHVFAVLTTISEELPDAPLFLSLHSLCATLKCSSPSAIIFRSAVINAGYRVSGTHVNPLGVKSNAPMDVIWDIMRCWVKNHPGKMTNVPSDEPRAVILSKEPVLQANFARAMASISRAQAKKIARFLPNPESHWGPKLRAGRHISTKHASLLGPNVVTNGRREDGVDEEPKSKHQKIEENDEATP